MARLQVSQALTAEELREAAQREAQGRVRARVLAMRHLLRGHGIEETAGLFGLGRTQLYEWVHRYNGEGLEGLADRPRAGRPPELAPEQETAFLERLHEGPPARSGLAAWRGEDIRRLLEEEFNARYSLSGVYALLHRLGQSSLVPRPHPPKSDPEAPGAFKKSAPGEAGRRTGRASR